MSARLKRLLAGMREVGRGPQVEKWEIDRHARALGSTLHGMACRPAGGAAGSGASAASDAGTGCQSDCPRWTQSSVPLLLCGIR